MPKVTVDEYNGSTSNDDGFISHEKGWYVVKWKGRYFKFSKTELLGGGSYGDVCKAYEIDSHTHKAIDDGSNWVAKIFSDPPTTAAKQITKQFYQCSPILTHQKKQEHFMLMENLGPDNLMRPYNQAINLAALPLLTKLEICLQITMQLYDMHQRTPAHNQVMHLDLKPHNVILKVLKDNSILPSITDFDLSRQHAKLSQEQQNNQPFEEYVFKPPFLSDYMAREMRGDALKQAYVSEKADIYSLTTIILRAMGSSKCMKDFNDKELPINYLKVSSEIDEGAFVLEKVLKNFLSQMINRDPYKRPDSEICLRFFQRLYQYCYLCHLSRNAPLTQLGLKVVQQYYWGKYADQFNSEETMNLESIALKNNNNYLSRLKLPLKAQISLISHSSAWILPWFLPSLFHEGKQFESHIIGQDDKLCKTITNNPDRTYPGRLALYSSLFQDFKKAKTIMTANISLAKKAYAKAMRLKLGGEPLCENVLLQHVLGLDAQQAYFKYSEQTIRDQIWKFASDEDKFSEMQAGTIAVLFDHQLISETLFEEIVASQYSKSQYRSMGYLCNSEFAEMNKKWLACIREGFYSDSELDIFGHLVLRKVQVNAFANHLLSVSRLSRDNLVTLVEEAAYNRDIYNLQGLIDGLVANEAKQALVNVIMQDFKPEKGFKEKQYYKCLLQDDARSQLVSNYALHNPDIDKLALNHLESKLQKGYLPTILDMFDQRKQLSEFDLTTCGMILGEFVKDDLLTRYLPEQTKKLRERMLDYVIEKLEENFENAHQQKASSLAQNRYVRKTINQCLKILHKYRTKKLSSEQAWREMNKPVSSCLFYTATKLSDCVKDLAEEKRPQAVCLKLLIDNIQASITNANDNNETAALNRAVMT